MKSLYIFRDGYESKFILSKLNKKGLVDGIILESGRTARQSKIKRLLRKTPFYKYPILILDVLSLIIYSKIIYSKIEKKLGFYNYPVNKVIVNVDDVNEEIVLETIIKLKPKLIFIFGTGIIKQKFLDKVNNKIFNIHTGILPFYKNVHSDFWALYKKDFENIGVSIIVVDRGVDTGAIVLKSAVDYKKNDSLADIKIKNLKLSVNLVSKIMLLKKITFKKQSQIENSSYPTPGFIHIVNFVRKKHYD